MPADELRDFANNLGDLSRADIAEDGAGALADVWVDTAIAGWGRDTNQLVNRTEVESVTGGSVTARAVVVADTPYAGFHNYGNRWTAPNRSWDRGFEAAGQAADGMVGARLVSSIERVMVSGGVWNPVRQ